MKYQARLLSAGSWLCSCLVIMLMAANPVVPEASMFNGTGCGLHYVCLLDYTFCQC